MPTSVNEELLNAAIRHQIEIARYSNDVVRRMVGLLNDTDARLFAELQIALDRLPPDSFTVQRLQAMLASVRSINAAAYGQIGQDLGADLHKLTAFEAQYQVMSLENAIPVNLHVASVTVDQVYAAAMDRPFEGVLLRDALSSLSTARANRVQQTVAQGYIQGRTVTQMVQELRGTRAANYSDGIIEIDRRNLRTIVHTAVQHTANFAREAVYDQNSDVIGSVMWSATLDNRTSDICRIRDHKQWTVDSHEPIGHDLSWMGGPPAHYNCRSCTVPVVKSWNDLLGVQGLTEENFPAGARASMDGMVPANVNYNQWLEKQSAARQDEVLGVTRGKLLREGKLRADQMYTQDGRFMTLAQLRDRYAGAFTRAGL